MAISGNAVGSNVNISNNLAEVSLSGNTITGNAYVNDNTGPTAVQNNKVSGILKVDRPQKYSNICPTPYGFIPQTFCGVSVAALCESRIGREGIRGDNDPLDICVLTERPAAHGDFIVRAIPIGGLRMIDGDEADDKIIAVLVDDASYGALQDVSELPKLVLERLTHYFLTYKNAPGSTRPAVRLTHVYGRDEAHEVIRRSQEDYRARFGSLTARLSEALRG